MALTKTQGVSISVATLLTWIPLIPVLWFVARPIVADAVAAELQESFEQKIEQETAPIQNAFRVLILRDIANLRRLIADREFVRDNQPDLWEADDAEDLVNLKLELESLQKALRELESDGD